MGRVSTLSCVLAALALPSLARELADVHAPIHARAQRLPGAPPVRHPGAPSLGGPRGDTPGVRNCTERFMDQRIDHFSFAATPTGASTYRQRFFTYDKYFDPERGVIFFYAGNEADVTLYVDHSGLMWEHAQAFSALIVFSEHRYYGASQPFGSASPLYFQYMTHEQAMADHATLAEAILAELGGDVRPPVFSFGGSYGGMLSTWLRIKYPSTFAGAIAASAPIAAFDGMSPTYDNSTYWAVVTDDASAPGGAAPACAANVRAAFTALFELARTPSNLERLSSTFQLCTPLVTAVDVDALAVTLHLNAWDTLAMGNYPYPSSACLVARVASPAYISHPTPPFRLLDRWRPTSATLACACCVRAPLRREPCQGRPLDAPHLPQRGLCRL